MTAKADPGQLPDGAGRAVGADNIVISGGTGPTGRYHVSLLDDARRACSAAYDYIIGADGAASTVREPSRRQETSWCPRFTSRPAAANAVSRIFSVRGCGIPGGKTRAPAGLLAAGGGALSRLPARRCPSGLFRRCRFEDLLRPRLRDTDMEGIAGGESAVINMQKFAD
jgi:hypothetical protein